MTERRCDTCIWWRADAPIISTGTRKPAGADPDIGTCHVEAPTLTKFGALPIPVGMFVETHASRFCFMWESIDPEPDDGAREDLPETVVPFRQRDAA